MCSSDLTWRMLPPESSSRSSARQPRRWSLRPARDSARQHLHREHRARRGLSPCPRRRYPSPAARTRALPSGHRRPCDRLRVRVDGDAATVPSHRSNVSNRAAASTVSPSTRGPAAVIWIATVPAPVSTAGAVSTTAVGRNRGRHADVRLQRRSVVSHTPNVANDGAFTLLDRPAPVSRAADGT